MNRFSVLFSLLSALILMPTLAQAQTAYANDGSNYLRLPQGYQQPQQAVTARPTFTGQGVGQGQMQQPQAMPTGASARMLPPGTTPMPVMQPVAQPVMQPMPQQSSLQPLMQQPAMQTAQPMLQPAPMQPLVQPTPMVGEAPQSAVRPVVMSHQSGIAGSMPMTNTVVMGGQSNVQLRPACDVPDNHRANNKGLNTSTTIQGDCLN